MIEQRNMEERFLKDTENHKMTVIFEDRKSFIRHIRFKKPESTIYYFDLITWKNHLCITGDMGTYVFSRVEDMFDFFRSNTLKINSGYWAEKVLSQSISLGDGVKKFSQQLFRDNIKDYYNTYFEDSDDDEEKKHAWEDIQELLDCEGEYECISAMHNFCSEHIEFSDFWECTNTEYTYNYLWCLYAIVWGIQQYDKLGEDPL